MDLINAEIATIGPDLQVTVDDAVSVATTTGDEIQVLLDEFGLTTDDLFDTTLPLLDVLTQNLRTDTDALINQVDTLLTGYTYTSFVEGFDELRVEHIANIDAVTAVQDAVDLVYKSQVLNNLADDPYYDRGELPDWHGLEWEITTTSPKFGTYCARLLDAEKAVTVTDAKAILYLDDLISPLATGETYSMGVWVKNSDPAQANRGFNLRINGVNSVTQTVDSDYTWTFLWWNAVRSDDSTERDRLQMRHTLGTDITVTGNIFIDAIVVVRGSHDLSQFVVDHSSITSRVDAEESHALAVAAEGRAVLAEEAADGYQSSAFDYSEIATDAATEAGGYASAALDHRDDAESFSGTSGTNATTSITMAGTATTKASEASVDAGLAATAKTNAEGAATEAAGYERIAGHSAVAAFNYNMVRNGTFLKDVEMWVETLPPVNLTATWNTAVVTTVKDSVGALVAEITSTAGNGVITADDEINAFYHRYKVSDQVFC